jgi:hypothetical protein
MAKRIATILGAVFVLVGIAGFFHADLLGAHLNTTHNLIHLISGAASLYFGLSGTASGARQFCWLFGAVYGLLGVFGFFMGQGEGRILTLPGDLLLGTPDHLIHILLGIAFVASAAMSKEVPRA